MPVSVRGTMRGLLGVAFAGWALASVPAYAEFTSAYTDMRLEIDCLVLDADDFGATWSCPGYKGYPVQVSEGDLRFAVVYGFNIDKEPERQTFGPFNELGEKIEWRLSNALGRWMPIATIVRYHLADAETGENSGQVLVVTQLVEGNSCHIAYVDARANDNANELARQAADKAGSFDCAKDAIAKPGKFAAW